MKLPDPETRGVRWRTIEVPDDAALSLAKALDVPPLVARLLWIRGHRSATTAGIFLRPRLADLQPPDALPDMAVATERIARAVRSREKIAICGDYDVDGMTGTALLVRFFRLAGGDVMYAIPDRQSDGYGLSIAGVERLAAAGVKLAITVDNGISAHDSIRRARELGIDVVVTDHHLPGATLPDALAIVDPHRTDRPGTPPSFLCGCGLAFKLAWGVAETLNRGTRNERLSNFLRDAVGYAALATVSDVVPLVGENRVIVTHGLAALRGSTHPGIRALLDSAGLSGATLTTDDIAWRLAPRLNAAGRMNRPDLAIDLLTTDDPATAKLLAAALEDANEKRRAIEKGVLVEAYAQAETYLSVSLGVRGAEGLGGGARRSLVVSGEGWHRGVIGIIAARLVDMHNRPTVVIGLEGDGGRGSCRTPRDFNLHTALSRCSEHLKRYGGHAAAAGLEVDRLAIPAFEEAFEKAVREQTADGEVEVTLDLDGEATAGDFTIGTVEHVRRLAPFGEANAEPRFLVRNATVAGRAKLMGSGSDHLSFAVKTDGGGAIRVVAFRRADLFDLVSSGVPLDLAVTPTVNEWRGLRTAELLLHDARPSV